ncbi:oxygenase MpaB family protein [Streptomyces sp. NPDC001941]|uniref:oxygenase MpaB family protein n=1 Tax=Streptomyces sp. NPDC001941 TaxID=3154659 RepID=UPI0033170E62
MTTGHRTDPPATGADAAPDPGIFGPGSVTWNCHGDPVMWIAGVRALYLQALHPVAVRGVMINSDFRKDAWGRLLRTAGFVGTLTYGTTEAAEKAGARVRRIHRLLGVDDPELLRWVHCAETDSYVSVLRRSGFPMDDAAADAYVDEHRRSARLVGLPVADVPASTAELAEYFRQMEPELEAGRDAREVDAFLRRPPVPPLLVPARALLWRHVSALAYQALPGFAHALYGRPVPDADTVTYRLTATANLLRTIPSRLRWQLPPGHILGAVARLGPDARPAPYKLDRGTAILDGPGRAHTSDGGERARWGTPG